MSRPCGTWSGYGGGCRCEACREAARTYQRERARAKGTGRSREEYIADRRTNPAPILHGTLNGYANRGCRCGECREACRLNAEQQRRVAGVRPRDEYLTSVRAPEHGYSGYINGGCRCGICRAAHREYNGQVSREEAGRRHAERLADRYPRDLYADSQSYLYVSPNGERKMLRLRRPRPLEVADVPR